ncbi:MAG: YfiR family protein [Verrucomicrobiota bacterium]|nr:YfiR family protein [Verrucomicrobiota bacterium]
MSTSLCRRRSFCRGKKPNLWAFAFAFVFCQIGSEVSAQTAPAREFQLKAIFLFNFTQFVNWPSEAFSSPSAPLVIGVLGGDPFGSFLDETVQGEKVDGHPLVVRRYRRVDEIQGCHILFISGTESWRLDWILSVLKGHSILTVGDWGDFTLRGGMIRFITRNHKIRFRINADAAKAAHLTISSKLLRLAETAEDGKD